MNIGTKYKAAAAIAFIIAAAGAYYILFYPAEFRVMAPDGSVIMLVCNGTVCEAPVIELHEGLPAHIAVYNVSPVRVVLVGENGEKTDITGSASTTLPETSPGLSGSGSNPGGYTLPEAPTDSTVISQNTLYLSVIVSPKPGQRVEIHVANRTYFAVFDDEGEVVATNIVDLPGPFSVASEDAKAAIITYVAAPFIAGLVFTFSAFGLGVGVRRR